MLEHTLARAKIACFLGLFLSPVLLSAWDKSLDRWLDSNHRWEALPRATIAAEGSITLAANHP